MSFSRKQDQTQQTTDAQARFEADEAAAEAYVEQLESDAQDDLVTSGTEEELEAESGSPAEMYIKANPFEGVGLAGLGEAIAVATDGVTPVTLEQVTRVAREAAELPLTHFETAGERIERENSFVEVLKSVGIDLHITGEVNTCWTDHLCVYLSREELEKVEAAWWTSRFNGLI